jgi:hypothetical protein
MSSGKIGKLYGEREKVLAGKPFRRSNLWGEPGAPNYWGRSPDWVRDYFGKRRVRYTIYSYQTPIAFWVGGRILVANHRYSLTTFYHQRRVAWDFGGEFFPSGNPFTRGKKRGSGKTLARAKVHSLGKAEPWALRLRNKLGLSARLFVVENHRGHRGISVREGRIQRPGAMVRELYLPIFLKMAVAGMREAYNDNRRVVAEYDHPEIWMTEAAKLVIDGGMELTEGWEI